jgi:hypothetical protein
MQTATAAPTAIATDDFFTIVRLAQFLAGIISTCSGNRRPKRSFVEFEYFDLCTSMPCAEYSFGLSCQISLFHGVPVPMSLFQSKRYDPEQRQEAQADKKAQKKNVLPPKPRRGLAPVPSL